MMLSTFEQILNVNLFLQLNKQFSSFNQEETTTSSNFIKTSRLGMETS